MGNIVLGLLFVCGLARKLLYTILDTVCKYFGGDWDFVAPELCVFALGCPKPVNPNNYRVQKETPG
ncbi:MAG: hypothetical protein P4L74_03055 [Candidatus Doudnabacteria bacterium]|nr:hypothetical protein [Candidatus Doudnabacteria bacterium]